MKNEFWKTKKLSEMSEKEWEDLCDGCGKCCFRKIVDGWLWKKRILNTRIACNLLDTGTCRCSDYENRFEKQPECIKLDRKKLKKFSWLPDTCAYRLVSEGKELPEWHPLVSGKPDSAKKAGVCVENPVREEDADDWYDYVTD